MITQNFTLVKGEAKNLPMTAKNSIGGIIDLTSASITFTCKNSYGDVSPVFTKRNTTAGGNDSQVLVVDADLGMLLVLINETSSLLLEVGTYYYDCQVNDGSTTIIYSGSLIVQQSVGDGNLTRRTSGTTAQRPTLTDAYEDIGFAYFDTTLKSPVWWEGDKWDDE